MRYFKFTLIILTLLSNKTIASHYDNYFQSAELNIIDKTTLRSYQITTSIYQPIKLGSLEIELRSCWSDKDYKEDKALIIAKEENNRIFSGWIFSSSPSLSSLEHPLYEITLQSCINTSIN